MQGFFTFAGVPSGDYVVTINGQGFQQFVENGVHLDPGDNRTLPSLKLQTGSANDTVTVVADTDVPLDTGERSDLITAEEIKHLSVEGRDVTELFKTLPGFAISNGSGGITNSAYDPSQVNVSGALGNHSANGNPVSGIDLRLDGADITDPGNYGSALQNINYDQVAEVKVQVSNFGADIANGPVVVSAVTTAGGDHFHGKLYTYARTNQLDSADALAFGHPNRENFAHCSPTRFSEDAQSLMTYWHICCQVRACAEVRACPRSYWRMLTWGRGELPLPVDCEILLPDRCYSMLAVRFLSATPQLVEARWE